MNLPIRLFVIAVLVLWTTARHEGSHALAAFAEGAEIQQVRLLPGVHENLGFYFGFVEHRGEVSWLTDAAPFIADVLLLLVTSLLLLKMNRHNRWWIFIFLFGVISPLADLGYGYFSGLWRAGTDVADLFLQLPPAAVHLFFLVSIPGGFLLARWLRNRS